MLLNKTLRDLYTPLSVVSKALISTSVKNAQDQLSLFLGLYPLSHLETYILQQKYFALLLMPFSLL